MKRSALGTFLTTLTDVVVALLALLFRLMDFLRGKNAGRKRPPVKTFSEEELAVVKALAAEKSYTRVEWFCELNDYDVFNPIDDTLPSNPICDIGFPELILLKEGRARWTLRKETSSILVMLPPE